MVLIAKCCVIIAIPLDTWLEIVQNLRPVASPEAVVAHDLIGKNHEILELEPMILHWGPEIKMNNCFHVKNIFLPITELMFSRKNIFHTAHLNIYKIHMSLDNNEFVYFYSKFFRNCKHNFFTYINKNYLLQNISCQNL